MFITMPRCLEKIMFKICQVFDLFGSSCYTSDTMMIFTLKKCPICNKRKEI